MTITTLEQLSPSVLGLLRRHNLHRKLLRALVIEEAVASVELADDVREKVWQKFCERNELDSAEALELQLRALNLSEGELRWQLELPLRTRKYSSAEFGHKAEARFLERKESLDQVVYSLLRCKDPGLARELYLQISGGEANFADLAAEYAEGPERSTRGIVGPVPLTQAHPALAERLRTTAPGELMEPFAIGEWWLVARLERMDPARFTKQVANTMAEELFEEWVRQEVTSKLERLPSAKGNSPTA